MTKDAGGPPADLQASRLRSDFGSRMQNGECRMESGEETK